MSRLYLVVACFFFSNSNTQLHNINFANFNRVRHCPWNVAHTYSLSVVRWTKKYAQLSAVSLYQLTWEFRRCLEDCKGCWVLLFSRIWQTVGTEFIIFNCVRKRRDEFACGINVGECYITFLLLSSQIKFASFQSKAHCDCGSNLFKTKK
jgi:hypothetical protein